MTLSIKEYRAQQIVNVHKHVDGAWFWTKYSAHPYIGCRSGCEFCYLRGGKYLGGRDPDSFDQLIQVKSNAAELLQKKLSKLTKDVVSVGDWQQAVEDRYMLSRHMLEIVLENEFPLFIVERSPLLLRDLDLLQEIHAQTNACVAISVSSLEPSLKKAFESRSPSINQRFEMMRKLSDAGIQVGLSMMPIIPFVGDSYDQLHALMSRAQDNGAQYALAGGISMDGHQAERSFLAMDKVDEGIGQQWREQVSSNDKAKIIGNDKNIDLANRVREISNAIKIEDRIPRYIAKGNLATNKLLAEKLFIKMRNMELARSLNWKIWQFRKAAWAIDELDQSVLKLYSEGGIGTIEKVAGIDKIMAARIEKWIIKHELIKEIH